MARPSKYNLKDLEINNSLLIPWRYKPGQHIAYNYMAIRQVVYRENQKGRRYVMNPMTYGMLITRVE